MLEVHDARSSFVTRAFIARVYPLRRPDPVRAPRRVDARVKRAHDGMGEGT